MDFKQIQELIKMINKSNIGEVTIEEKGFKLTIKQKEEPAQNLLLLRCCRCLLLMPSNNRPRYSERSTSRCRRKTQAQNAQPITCNY